jgi:hypothetical protein
MDLRMGGGCRAGAVGGVVVSEPSEIKITTDELIKGYAKHPESQFEAVQYATKLAKRRIEKEKATSQNGKTP